MVEAMARELPYYSWTGIPVTQGICGAAVASGETVIVDDVGSDPRYLSCSIETKSEIVVPIYAHGKVIGEIDIDSHDPAAFTDADRTFLEEAARIVGTYVESHSGEAFILQTEPAGNP